MSAQTKLWWRNGVIYQVYPRSFQDSDDDGVGDLRGILARLDYLVELGVDAVWISPFYPSPMADFGYDVANYTEVDPLFGTLADFDLLLLGAHARGFKIILDFVPNHSSDQHPWFLDSRSARDAVKRDWYLWRDPEPEGGPPNNWLSNFGGSAWTFDETTNQYYYHSFLKQQPDLNWRNPEVREAMYAAMRFWLDKGVDGFRMDVLWLLIKDDQFRSNPPDLHFNGGSSFWSLLPRYTGNQPETHGIVAEMRTVMDRYNERVLIGEIYLPIKDLISYYGATPELMGAQMPFNFHLIQTAWQAARIAQLIRDYEAELPAGAWPNWVLGNHDQKRLATRVGHAQSRVAAVLLLTLRGTPTLYYGDELGMPNAAIAPHQVQDPAEINQPGIGQGRDPERSPMLWDAQPQAGFTAGTPWLPLIDDWPSYTVQSESADAQSVLSLYRRLLAVRRQQPALHAGAITDVVSDNSVLSYIRFDSLEQRVQVVLNLTSSAASIICGKGRVLLNSFLDDVHSDVGGALALRADEAVVILLDT